MRINVDLWKCTHCHETNTNLKKKSKDGFIICSKCGKKTPVPFSEI